MLSGGDEAHVMTGGSFDSMQVIRQCCSCGAETTVADGNDVSVCCWYSYRYLSYFNETALVTRGGRMLL